jgi:hypothetical protein
VWCGVVWCGVVWCGVVWCGVVWCAPRNHSVPAIIDSVVATDTAATLTLTARSSTTSGTHMDQRRSIQMCWCVRIVAAVVIVGGCGSVVVVLPVPLVLLSSCSPW